MSNTSWKKFALIIIVSSCFICYVHFLSKKIIAMCICRPISFLLNRRAEPVMFACRLHSAGHLIDICMSNIGLSHFDPGKGHHFPDGPFVEYKGVIPPDQLQDKKNELEKEANELITKGAKVRHTKLFLLKFIMFIL
jgi:hypothetical protein